MLIDLLPGVRAYLKDESGYPSGSHKEPAAYAVVARALADGHDRVFVGSCGSYGRAMATACAEAGLKCTVVMPEGWGDSGEFAEMTGAEVRFAPGGYEDAVEESHRLADEAGAADGNVDGPYQDAVLAGHGLVVDALHAELGPAPTTMWIPVGNGTTIVAMHRRLRALGWQAALHGVGSPGNNPIVTSWPGRYLPLPSDAVVTTEHNEPLVNWHALSGPQAMAAIADSGGAVHAATDDELLAARASLARHHLDISPSGAAGLAGLLRTARAEPLTGTPIVVLTGRPH
ncbi:pyridoxal-phosphate dependent enzyme [Actinoplanes couchii]|uniref:Threonine synthase n=1 Tax=Actinoplanes couchii TaxID=403638 RepID=A0ABQ3XCT7_9ACTN|nr:pyridoxal-phosphate dependent enzyme [Actinoplanes couchii]MDR6321210.1 threonine synthase [Actinoplanes couchii]GID56319.1 threonine synthase [Actinoplanes couchii]